MSDPFADIIQQTLAAHEGAMGVGGAPLASAAFQWPWDIAKAGAKYLGQHRSAINALVAGGSAVSNSPQGPAIIKAIASGPTNSANTGQMLNNGIFTNALGSVKADQLLRTVFIGWSTGAQVGLFGGGGGSGVAYDIIDSSNCAAVSFGSFNLGIGGGIAAGILLGAMTAEPHSLNFSTSIWQFGASLGVSVTIMVIMNSDDLSLVGFGINLGGGGGVSSSTGYGKISAA